MFKHKKQEEGLLAAFEHRRSRKSVGLYFNF